MRITCCATKTTYNNLVNGERLHARYVIVENSLYLPFQTPATQARYVTSFYTQQCFYVIYPCAINIVIIIIIIINVINFI